MKGYKIKIEPDSSGYFLYFKKEVQSVAGKWVRVEIAKKGFQCELSKYPWGEV